MSYIHFELFKYLKFYKDVFIFIIKKNQKSLATSTGI